MDFETFGAAKGSENRLVPERVFPALHHQGELVVYALRALLLQFDQSTRKSKTKTNQMAMKARRKEKKEWIRDFMRDQRGRGRGGGRQRYGEERDAYRFLRGGHWSSSGTVRETCAARRQKP